jgi:sugar O-acyltransferase (sialic acid O-acetyltransferase NeuD family)
MKPKILIFGSGGHACSVIDAVESQGKFEVAGFLDSYRPVGHMAYGYPVLGNEFDIPELYVSLNCHGIVIAIGDNHSRMELYLKVTSIFHYASFPVVVHKTAVVSPTATVHQGSVVMAGSIINSKATINEFSIVNTNSVIEHECVLGYYTSVGPSACLGGRVIVMDRSAVMLGTSVAHGIIVENDSIVGAGSVVINNIPDKVVVVGVPGRIVRKREIGERYL